ncbi:MAG: class I SAM-dependent methyltransferase [Bacteriovoracaceae bacterium]|nr:class I SAM-dependent methyltransferase [Bacteroidota bacterium]
MAKIVSQYLSHQHAPALVLRFPRILFLYYWINHLSVLRMKYARRAIRTVLQTTGTPHTVIDAGCGMGDYAFSVPEFKKAKKVIGIDVSPSNIDACNRLAASTNANNMEFVCSDLGTAILPYNTDMILCIGVLMYIGNDSVVLKNFHASLSQNGTLLIYVAVNYRRNLSLYRRFAKKPGFDYDEIIGRPQTYTDTTLEQLLSESGFTILEKKHSFGKFAATMFEISAMFEWFFKSWHPLTAIILIPFYLLFYPLYLLSMTIDYHGSRSTGNGVMIIAKKKRDLS